MFKKIRDDAEKYDVVDKFSIVVMPEGAHAPFPYSGIPDQLFQCAQTVITATGISFIRFLFFLVAVFGFIVASACD